MGMIAPESLFTLQNIAVPYPNRDGRMIGIYSVIYLIKYFYILKNKMILPFLYLLFFISIVTVILFYKKDSWSNTYSGWPGPIENPYATNVPALYGNPKYMSKCKYTYNPKSTTGYLSMKNLPN